VTNAAPIIQIKFPSFLCYYR